MKKNVRNFSLLFLIIFALSFASAQKTIAKTYYTQGQFCFPASTGSTTISHDLGQIPDAIEFSAIAMSDCPSTGLSGNPALSFGFWTATSTVAQSWSTGAAPAFATSNFWFARSDRANGTFLELNVHSVSSSDFIVSRNCLGGCTAELNVLYRLQWSDPLQDLSPYATLSYLNGTFPTYTYASSTYYFQTNPSGYSTSSGGSSIATSSVIAILDDNMATTTNMIGQVGTGILMLGGVFLLITVWAFFAFYFKPK